MPDLVLGYFGETLDDAFVETVVHLVSGRTLDWQRIEDAAYFRRFQALLHSSVDGSGSTDDAAWW